MNEQPYILLVNGPNLNRLGGRQPAIYGTDTLDDVEDRMSVIAESYGVNVISFQSNHEGELIDFLQRHGPQSIGIVLNPGALAHYGLSLRDCLDDLNQSVIEVHISNVHERESFRHVLVLSPVVHGQIVGLGTAGYDMAARYLLDQFMQINGGGHDSGESH